MIGVLIQNTVIEVQKVQEGQGAGLLGVGLTLDLTQGLEVWLVHILGLGHPHLDLVHEINTAIIHDVVDHLHTLLIAVMMEDEPKGSLDPVGKKIAFQVKNTAVALRRYAAENTEAEINLQVRESTVKAYHL